MAFGLVQVGTTARRTFTIVVPSGCRLEWTLVITGNSADVISIDRPATSTISPPNSVETINVVFTPRSAGSYSGTFVVQAAFVASDGGGGNLLSGTAPWSGEGTQAAFGRAVLSTDPVLDFGTVAAGTSVTKQLAVRNTGSAPLTVDRVQTNTGCGVRLPYPRDLAPGSSEFITYICTIPLGMMTGTTIITSNASNSLVTVQLTGRGQ